MGFVGFWIGLWVEFSNDPVAHPVHVNIYQIPFAAQHHCIISFNGTDTHTPTHSQPRGHLFTGTAAFMLLSLDRRRGRGPSSAGNDGFIRPEVCRSVQMYTQGWM